MRKKRPRSTSRQTSGSRSSGLSPDRQRLPDAAWAMRERSSPEVQARRRTRSPRCKLRALRFATPPPRWARRCRRASRVSAATRNFRMERTFAIIKPDAVAAGRAGAILAKIEENGFKIRGMKMTRLSQAQAEGFYAVHRERGFFSSLVTFMTEGPVVVLALERDNAIAKWRELMGATNPANAAEGTIRKLFAESIERNAVHGSDAPETAAIEQAYFFNSVELNQL